MANIGLAISGGGIKAFASVGVVRLAKENGITFSSYAGTSMGSVIASLLACGIEQEEMETLLLDLEQTFIKDKIFTPNIKVMPFYKHQINGLVDADLLENVLKEVFEKFNVIHIKDVPVPLFIPAVDLISGKLVIFTNKKEAIDAYDHIIVEDDVELAKAVRASCAFPFVFNSTKHKDLDLIDGGVRMNLPIWPLKQLKKTKVLSVSMLEIEKPKEYKSILDVSIRAADLMIEQSVYAAKTEGDLNINVHVSAEHPFDLNKGRIVIEEGYVEAQKNVEKLKKLNKKVSLFG